MLSICTTIKNRSRVVTDKGTLNLFPNCVKSIANSLNVGEMNDVELVISDWCSTDWPILEWIENIIPYIPIHIVHIEGNGFSAGAGRNIAARAAKGDILLFLDADMIANSRVIKEGWESAKQGNVFYPIVKYQIDGGKQIIHEGGGNLFIRKDIFNELGGWPELWSWGYEDTIFAEEVKKSKYPLVTSNVPIFHQWHPQDRTFKNKFSSIEDPIVIQKRNKTSNNIKKEIDAFAREIIPFVTSSNTTHQNLNPVSKL